jgi:LuxR family maltose regulon positive regulatory protein
MAAQLLTTKLHIPPARAELVSRPPLVERLNAGLRRRLTLISAPAGFGKTTLLSEWASRCPRPVAWLSLDEGDNDPVRFLAHLVAALQRVGAIVPDEATELILEASSAPTSTVATTLINQIGASKLAFVLILDDYHLIAEQAIHDALTFLLEHLPPNMHLVIASRADPPLSIARLRARGQLTELRQSDLRFDLHEVSQFLNEVMRLGLAPADVRALLSRTEGWIAGLQMAAVSIRGHDARQRTHLIQDLTGSNRYIMDYLVEEVLERQPDQVQTFLLQTSVLEQLSGPLCDAVVAEGAQGQQTLEYLDRANLFVIPLDNRREWYRYHRLFGDLLRKRLSQTDPTLEATLHRRASAWYESHGYAAAAIDHALSAEDFRRAADLMEQTAEKTVMRSELVTFLRWVARLPDELLAARPSLGVLHAWALLLTGRWVEAADSYLEQPATGTDIASWKMAPIRALMALFQGRVPAAAEMSRRALEELPRRESFLRNIAAWNLSLSQLAEGDVSAGRQTLEELVQVSQQTGNYSVAVMAMTSLALLQRRLGRLREAEVLYRRALELAADEQGNQLPIASEPLMGLGEIWREWNDLSLATKYLEQGIESAQRWAETSALDGYMSLVRVKQSQGDVEGARNVLLLAQQMAEQFDGTDLDDLMVDLLRLRLSIAQGDIASAEHWTGQRPGDKYLHPEEGESGFGFVRSHMDKYERLLLARLRIAQQRPSDAVSLLEPLLALTQSLRRVDLLIEVEVLRALALQQLEDQDQALASLEHALNLAQPGGYVRIFVDEGPPMARLLYRAAERGMAPEYAGQLLAAFPAAPAAEPPVSEMVEPLSNRELDVLQLIAEGLSNRQIAARLFLALPTVKWHSSNIYGKLGVSSRTQAVTRARALGILATD